MPNPIQIPVLLGIDPYFGAVFVGDTYCVKHQELLSPGLDIDADGNRIETCPYCDFPDFDELG